MISLGHFGKWLLEIHGDLLAGWINPIIMAGPAGALSFATITHSPTKSWRGTALVCLAGITVGVQVVVGMIAAALLMSHWYPTIPDGEFYRILPLRFGIANAFPLMFGALILINRRTDRQTPLDRERAPQQD